MEAGTSARAPRLGIKTRQTMAKVLGTAVGLAALAGTEVGILKSDAFRPGTSAGRGDPSMSYS